MDSRTLISARRRCVDFVSAIRGAESIIRVVPIAFPVFQSTWRINLRVEKDTGLVERHLLRTIRRLGPVSPEELRKLTGFDCRVLEKAIADLQALGLPVEWQNGKWQLDGETDIQHGCVLRIHDFAFFSNGLTGAFLPLAQYAELRGEWVAADEIGKFQLHALPPLCAPGEGTMAAQLGLPRRPCERLDTGIPEGFEGFVSKHPENSRLRHVLAFGFGFADGSFGIFSSGGSGYRFECPGGDAARYLGTADKAGCPPMEGLKVSDKGNVRRIVVRDESLWEQAGTAATPDSPAWLLRRMVWPGWMCDSDRSFHLLAADNKKTARALAVQRGCSLLRNTCETVRSADDLGRLAERFAEETRRGIPGLKDIPAFTEVLEAALRSQDGDVSDFARRFLPVAREKRHVAEREPQAFFLRSQGSRFHEMLVAAMQNAKKSIRIAVPVLDEEGVFGALEDAARRDVEIKVVTQLPDHRTHRVKTDPQFKDYALPRRKLAALGARVRDCGYTVHAKFGIIDSQLVFFTSANLNANGLGVGKSNSLEVAVEFDDRFAAEAAECLFQEIWNHAQYEQVRHDEHISIRRRPRAGDMRMLSCIQRVRDATFLLSTPENGVLARKMAEMIVSARKEVRMAAMSLYDLAEVPELFAAMKAALRNKVKMRIAVRPPDEMKFSPAEWPDPSTKELMACGLEIATVPHLHAKGLVADRKAALMASANFNPYSLGNGPTAHIELGLAGSTATPYFKDFSACLDDFLASGGTFSR